MNLLEDCSLQKLTADCPIDNFACSSPDLDDFFKNDAIKYQEELLGETFFYRSKTSGEVICAYTISNDSIRVNDLPNSRVKKVRKDIPHAKALESYPALLIGRLGVNVKHARQGIGTQLLDFIKGYCLTEYGAKCRFIVVDSYNLPEALGLYTKNEFDFVFSTEEQEKGYYMAKKVKNETTEIVDEPLKTRFMYFDLKVWADKLTH
jgi:ribosomal protein S18 acetylase RimI-like enzyme